MRNFPHSVRFSIDRVRDALARVAPGAPPARRAAVERLAGRLKATVDFGQIEELMSGAIVPFLADITRQCEQIHDAVYVVLHSLRRGDGAVMVCANLPFS